MSVAKKKSSIKNAREVYWSWRLGERMDKTLACWTDGVAIYSYATALMVRAVDGLGKPVLVLNQGFATRYTSPYQEALQKLAALDSETIQYVYAEVDTGPEGLHRLAGTNPAMGEATVRILKEASAPAAPTPEPITVKKNDKLYGFNDTLGF